MYGFFVPYFAASFFPVDDRAARILAAFAVFAVGFFFRPLGGAILGSYADRRGRRAGMTLTILLMAGASALIAYRLLWFAVTTNRHNAGFAPVRRRLRRRPKTSQNK